MTFDHRMSPGSQLRLSIPSREEGPSSPESALPQVEEEDDPALTIKIT